MKEKILGTKIRFSLLLFCFLAIFFLWGTNFSMGATSKLYIDIPATISVDSEFEANVFIDSDISLNAYNIVVAYSPDALLAEEINNSNSIIDVWQNQPNLNKPGEIEIVGGSLHEFTGSQGKLLTIRFKAIQKGKATLVFKTAEAYMANGKGTKTDLERESASLSISEGTPVQITEKKDINPPEISFLALEEDPLNPNQQFLSFLVRDNGSGVKEAMARYRTWIFWSEWTPVDNPAAIPSNAWAVGFRVADNFENQAAQVIYYWPIFLKNFFPILLIAVVLLLFLMYRIGRIRKQS
ncbi:MAG: cohesin domain-containing protein [Patescibacteria group bacterium]